MSSPFSRAIPGASATAAGMTAISASLPSAGPGMQQPEVASPPAAGSISTGQVLLFPDLLSPSDSEDDDGDMDASNPRKRKRTKEYSEEEKLKLADRLEPRTRDYTDLPSGHPNELAAYNAKIRRLQRYCNALYALHGVVFVGHAVHPHYGSRTIVPEAKEFGIGRELQDLFGESPFRANTILVNNLVTHIDDYRRKKTTTPPSLHPPNQAMAVPAVSPFPDPTKKEAWRFIPFKKLLLHVWAETFRPPWIAKHGVQKVTSQNHLTISLGAPNLVNAWSKLEDGDIVSILDAVKVPADTARRLFNRYPSSPAARATPATAQGPLAASSAGQGAPSPSLTRAPVEVSNEAARPLSPARLSSEEVAQALSPVSPRSGTAATGASSFASTGTRFGSVREALGLFSSVREAFAVHERMSANATEGAGNGVLGGNDDGFGNEPPFGAAPMQT